MVTAEKIKPYVVNVILEEPEGFFAAPIFEKPNYLQRMGTLWNRFTFKYLVVRGFMRYYLGVIAVMALLILIFGVASLASVFHSQISLSLMYLGYVLLLLLILPYFAYLFDAYQAMQLRLGMNIAVRQASYQKHKEGADSLVSPSKFEWEPTTLAILNAIIHEKKNYSYGELAKLAKVNRQTIAGKMKKLLSSGLIRSENGYYSFSGVSFDIKIRKGKKLEEKLLSEDEKQRANYLFEVMCFIGL